MDVRFVDDEHRVFRLVGENVFQIFFRGERAGGIIRIADVERARIRVGLDHGFHVVRMVGTERNLNGLRANPAARAAAVTGAGHDPASGGRRERRRAIRQRNARTGKGDHVILRDVLGGREQGGELHILALRRVAPAHRRNLDERFQTLLARAHGIFVGRDADHIRVENSGAACHSSSAASPARHGGLLLRLLCQGKFAKEWNSGCRPHGNAGDLPAGKSSFNQRCAKFGCQCHRSKSPGELPPLAENGFEVASGRR